MAAFGGAIAIVLVLAWLVLGHLGHPAIKRRLVETVARTAGVTVDYSEASVSLSRFHLAGLRVSQPPPDEAGAPLLAIDRIDVRFNPWSALHGGPVTIHDLTIQGVRTVVQADDDGTNSFTRIQKRLPPSPPKPVTPPSPLSQTLTLLAELPVRVDAAHIQDVEATLIRRAAGHPVETVHFQGMELSLSVIARAFNFTLETPTSGTQLDLTRGDAHQRLRADVRLSVDFDARAKGNPHGVVTTTLKLQEQNLVALPAQAPAISEVAALKVSFSPDAAAHKTTVKVEQLRLLDGTGAGALDADLIDEAATVRPLIRQASLHMTLDRLRGFVPSTFGDLQALSGGIDLSASGVDLSKGIHINPDGGAELAAELPRVLWKDGANVIDLSKLKLELHGRTLADGVELDSALHLDSLEGKWQGQALELARGTSKLHAQLSSSRHLQASLSGAFEHLHAQGGPELTAKGGAVEAKVTDGVLAEGPLSVSGKLVAEASFHSLSAKQQGLAMNATDLKLRLPVHVQAKGTGSVEGHVTVAQLGLQRNGKPLGAPAPAHVDLVVPHFTYDAATPLHSTAEAKLELALGALSSTLQLQKSAHDVRYQLNAKATTLGMARPFVADRTIPLEKMALALDSKGTASKLEAGPAMQLSHETSLRVEHGAFRGAEVDAAFDRLTAKLSSHGNSIRHELDGSLNLTGLTLQGHRRPGATDLKLHASFDRTQPKAELRFEGAGEACPEGHLNLTFGFDRSRQRVSYTADGELHRLDLIPEFLPAAIVEQHQVEWKRVSLALQGKGDIDGAVTAFHDLKPVVAKDPLKALRGTQTLGLTLKGLHYENDQDQLADFDALQLSLDAKEEDEQRHLRLSVDMPRGQFNVGDTETKLEGLSSMLTVDTGGGEAHAHLHTSLGALNQSAYPAYLIGDASLDAVVTAGQGGAVRIDSVKFDNPTGGTTLEATGSIESLLSRHGELLGLQTAQAKPGKRDRKGVILNGTVLQRLETLPKSMDIAGRGLLRLPFAVESGDLHHFRTATAIEFKNASLTLRGRNISVGNLNARIPIKQDLLLDEEGLQRLGGAQPGVYSRERFFDYQPFLGNEDYVTLDTLKVGDLVMGPIAGNLRIDRNLVALDQLEMTALGGKVTGQIIVNYDPADPQATDVLFRGNVTGAAPAQAHGGSGDVVDANAALRLNPRRLELEGRIDIVRIGRDDLRAMLDAWDPYHIDVSANRTRQALSLGYPKEVRLLFRQGFASITIELGGLAAAMGIDSIQALPTGPLLEKYVGPYIKPKGTP